MPLAAPFDLSGAAFALRPSFASVARELGWCEYDYPRWGGHTFPNVLAVTFSVLVAPASLIGPELLQDPL
jgi:hypothetical protein